MYLQLTVWGGEALLQYVSFRICIVLSDDDQYVWSKHVAENSNEQS